MKKMMPFVLMVFVSAALVACESKTTVIREGVAVPVPQADPGVKIKINDGSGSGVDVNIPTKK